MIVSPNTKPGCMLIYSRPPGGKNPMANKWLDKTKPFYSLFLTPEETSIMAGLPT